MSVGKLPVVFLLIGNHGDVSRFLQELITQLESMVQQVICHSHDELDHVLSVQTGEGWQSLLMLFAHSMDWLLTHRSADFHHEWTTKWRLLPLFPKVLPLLSQSRSK